MMASTEQLLRLPKWAQSEIRNLTQQRDEAVRKLYQYEDNQTPSNVWVDELVHVGDHPSLVTRYFQCDRLEIEQAGVHLDVCGLHGHEPIQLSWRPASRRNMGDVCFIPTSYQQARLVALENAR